MTVDTERLRELANAATEPCTVGDYRRFSDATNPQAIIALIDDLERTKAQLAEANEALRFYASTENWQLSDSLGDRKICGRISRWGEGLGDISVVRQGHGVLETAFEYAGKRARQYLEEWKVGK